MLFFSAIIFSNLCLKINNNTNTTLGQSNRERERGKMSRSAGTLVTTYNATYNPPAMMPGYRGHVPTVSRQYGETFANSTRKYFNDYREQVLNSSESLYSRGGYFPSSYSNNPELAVHHRRLQRDQNLFTPKYELANYNFDRTRDIGTFYQARGSTSCSFFVVVVVCLLCFFNNCL